jgi:hypothetical protein
LLDQIINFVAHPEACPCRAADFVVAFANLPD